MPGNPIQTMIGKLTGQVTPQEINAIRLVLRRGTRIGRCSRSTSPTSINSLHGNLGMSLTLATTVSTILRGRGAMDDRIDRRLDHPQLLDRHGCGALLGWTRGSRLDSLIPTATFFQAIPYFFLATVMLLVFASNLHWFPVLGAYSRRPATRLDVGLRRERAALRRVAGDLDRARVRSPGGCSACAT